MGQGGPSGSTCGRRPGLPLLRLGPGAALALALAEMSCGSCEGGGTPGSSVPPRRALRVAPPVPLCLPDEGWGPSGKHPQSSQVFENLLQQGRRTGPASPGAGLLPALRELSLGGRVRGQDLPAPGQKESRASSAGRVRPEASAVLWTAAALPAPPAKLDLLIGIAHSFSV